MQARFARPVGDLEQTAAFYRDLVGVPVLASFADHDGFSGVVLGVPDRSSQLELVAHEGVRPAPSSEDLLVLYLSSANEVTRLTQRLADGGVAEAGAANPYWARTGARCFLDPDGYRLVLSPLSWAGGPAT